MSTLDPDSADLSLLQDRQVAVLGYDAVGAAHALNLRDSGVEVRVGADPDGRAAARAELDGLMVMTPADAVAACDVVLVPGDDLTGVQELLDAGAEAGDLVVVTSSGPLREGGLRAPDGVDVVMLKAVGDGRRIREEYLDGRGCPALVAVHLDRSGAAWATLTAYAAALGSLRSGAIVTTVEHEAQAQEHAQTHLHGPLQRILQQSFDTLVERGVEEEVAYLALVHDLRARVEELSLSGPAGQATELRMMSMMSWRR